MKNVKRLLVLAFFTACMTILYSCKKDAEIPTPELPTVTTTAVSDITGSHAAADIKVTFNGSAGVTDCGICWSTTHSPTIADNKAATGVGAGTFTLDLDGLTANTTYYVRSYATNSVGTAYGNEISFTTIRVVLPTLTTMEVTNITVASAVSGGIITDDGGVIATSGVCWSTTPNPTTNNDKSYDGLIEGLQPSTKYYVRAFATNSAGTAYGNELNFTTSEISSVIFNPDLTYGSVSDVDGNAYKTIQIGTQLWMAENLKTTRYNDGSSIPYITGSTRATNGYIWYNNDASSYKTVYGALYNWYAVTDSRNLCPTGWHVPTTEDWSTLTTYLGDATVAGGKMKETGITHWLNPNSGGHNESGFTALPGGWYYPKWNDPDEALVFSGIGYHASWWSATSTDPSGVGANFVSVSSNGPDLSNEWQAFKINGLSVRCVKDN